MLFAAAHAAEPVATSQPSPAARARDEPAAKPPPRPAPRRSSRPDAGKPAAPPEIVFTEAEVAKLEHLAKIAQERYPKRRDTPLRYANISDNEVREIERLAENLRMPQLVNISPVVTGCACEEGAECTEQVYVITRFEDRHVGLQLSRVKNRWGIGRVQRWWLEYAALLAREQAMEKTLYKQAHARQLLEFPLCPTGTTLERATTSAAVSAAPPGAKR
jgi:hypothetical protein